MLGEPPAAFKKYGQDKTFFASAGGGDRRVTERFKPAKIGMAYRFRLQDTLMEVI